ncbi:protein FLX-like 3 [Quercus robur]|uniref:protein FLX-like 3 n=1 Tax=Quercus robur TaxID=38942 RepID=UPI002163A295|nr:protein FLX-like 3 [Quercus robur]XP_050241074.1 protein FLX-like 3 [Quercus robur]XP_050241079.1 protein FLX-like 3 [Quercus robur]
MSGRNRMPRHPENFRGLRDVPRSVMNHGPGPLPIHPAALEDELEMQHREMQRIIAENRLVIDDNTHLQRELTAAKDEIHRLGQVIPKLRVEKEVQARELIERGLKLEADLRASEPLRSEVMQLRAEVQNLNALRQDLSTQVQRLTQDVNRAQAENQQLIAMSADMDGMRKDLIEARRAYEYEKKAKEEQLEMKQSMEKNLISMAREIEKLKIEQLNTERRARELGGGGYGMLNGSPEMRYQSDAFGYGYGSGWGHYDKRDPPRR